MPPRTMKTGKTITVKARYVVNPEPEPPPIAVGELVTLHCDGMDDTEWIVESVTHMGAQLKCLGKPANARWASRNTQVRNSSHSLKLVDLDDKPLRLSDIAFHLAIHGSALHKHLKRSSAILWR